MRLRLTALVLLLGACSSSNSPLLKGELKPEGGNEPKVERVAVLRVEVNGDLRENILAYGEAGCSFLMRHKEADLLLYLIHVPENTYGEHPELTYPFAVHRSQCLA